MQGLGGLSNGQTKSNDSTEKVKRAPMKKISWETSVIQPQACRSTEHRTEGGLESLAWWLQVRPLHQPVISKQPQVFVMNMAVLVCHCNNIWFTMNRHLFYMVLEARKSSTKVLSSGKGLLTIIQPMVEEDRVRENKKKIFLILSSLKFFLINCNWSLSKHLHHSQKFTLYL